MFVHFCRYSFHLCVFIFLVPLYCQSTNSFFLCSLMIFIPHVFFVVLDMIYLNIYHTSSVKAFDAASLFFCMSPNSSAIYFSLNLCDFILILNFTFPSFSFPSLPSFFFTFYSSFLFLLYLPFSLPLPSFSFSSSFFLPIFFFTLSLPSFSFCYSFSFCSSFSFSSSFSFFLPFPLSYLYLPLSSPSILHSYSCFQ